MDARIGQLTREGRPVFYAYLNGYNQEPFEGTLEQVEIELGLRLPADLDLAEDDAPAALPAPVKASRLAWNLRTYLVTITPRYKLHYQTWQSSEYRLEIDAENSNEAIKKARAEHNENNWNNPAKYRAKLKQ